jgi:hypothetical protein
MAVGDIVSALSGVNTVLDLQPAVGVEIMISSQLVEDTRYLALFDGTNSTAQISNTNYIDFLNSKFFINNTNYMRILGRAASRNGYTGIQIK